MTYLEVRHNIEVAHRLLDLRGKCEAIHGHSMWVTLRLHGHLDKAGILEGLDFGSIKKQFRTYLDDKYDHHLLLNEKDPWAGKLVKPYRSHWVADGAQSTGYSVEDIGHLPGLVTLPGDPTTENIAKWIAQWAVKAFELNVDVHVQETYVNGAGYSLKGYRNGS